MQALILSTVLLFYWRELRLVYGNSSSFLRDVLPESRAQGRSEQMQIELPPIELGNADLGLGDQGSRADREALRARA